MSLWARGPLPGRILSQPHRTLRLFRVKEVLMNGQLRAFQKQFIRGALAPGIDVAALSIPRGNGKSWLAAHLLRRCLTLGDDLHVPGSEYLLCAASIEQARLCYRFIRVELEPKGGVLVHRLGNAHRHHSLGQQHSSEGTVQQREDGHGNCKLPSLGGRRTRKLGDERRHPHV